MKIATTQKDGRPVVKIEGNLRVSGVAAVKVALLAALNAGNGIELDLANLTSCDTAGIQVLLMARTSARVAGKVFLVSAASADFKTALSHAGVAIESLAYSPETAGQ